MRGAFKQKPTKPRYLTTWDVTTVLEYLDKLPPLKDLKLKEATEKVATLLALATGYRMQTLQLINIDNIERSNTYLSIKIPDLNKTSGPGRLQPDLICPFFSETPGLCVSSIILEYLECTKERRGNTKNLLISTVKPHGAVSSDTISHGIRGLLTKAGIDTTRFTAYSTRHAAVSSAHKRGVDISIIKRAAGWISNSKMFLKVYKRPIEAQNDEFAHAILQK